MSEETKKKKSVTYVIWEHDAVLVNAGRLINCKTLLWSSSKKLEVLSDIWIAKFLQERNVVV